jgi:hypothetical protein
MHCTSLLSRNKATEDFNFFYSLLKMKKTPFTFCPVPATPRLSRHETAEVYGMRKKLK